MAATKDADSGRQANGFRMQVRFSDSTVHCLYKTHIEACADHCIWADLSILYIFQGSGEENSWSWDGINSG